MPGKKHGLQHNALNTFNGAGSKSTLSGTTSMFCTITKFETAVLVLSRNGNELSSQNFIIGSLVMAASWNIIL